MPDYRPVDPRKSPRFAGIKTFMRLPHIETAEDIDFAVVGVPFDTGASYRVGARFGPEAFRSVSALLRHYSKVNPGYTVDSYKMIEEGLEPLLDAGVVPIMLGGDHSVTLPELRAVAKKYGPVALIHFDSHSDTGDKRFGRKYTHGTPMRRALEEGLLLVEKSIQVGMRGSIYARDSLDEARVMGFDLVNTNQAFEMGLDTLIKRIRDRVGDAKAFVSFDIDFIDPAYAPGTGTPEVGGFTSREALRLVRGLDGLDIVAYDMVEVLPQYDPSQVTALLAANIVYEFISLIALEKKRGASA